MNRITQRSIACAIEVHRALGCWLYESVCGAALAMESDVAGVKYTREMRLPTVYKGELVGEYARTAWSSKSKA
jgi:GxxExxY protein